MLGSNSNSNSYSTVIKLYLVAATVLIQHNCRSTAVQFMNSNFEMACLEEPVLSRLNRLDNILKQLEDIHHQSPKSSYASTTSSDGHPPSFADMSPERLEKRCRPFNEVMMEVEEKGTLIQRLLHAEDRILKVCLQLEEELMEGKSASGEMNIGSAEKKKMKKKSPTKGLKQFVKSCVRVKPNLHL